jgi:DNA-binding response OmpR family regulator
MTDTILLVEDDPLQRQLVMALLRKKMGYKVMQAAKWRHRTCQPC